MKIVTVIGARPQFIKAATVSRALRKIKSVEEVLLHTGQHFDGNMSSIFFSELEIPKPKYHLNINSLPHGAMTGRMLESIEKILLHEKPDWVIVFGDTNSTLAGALAAKKLHIRVAHVEAGLRHYDQTRPEELNRVLTDHVADLLCCPTKQAVVNLRREGLPRHSAAVVLTGDVMYDSALYFSKKAESESSVLKKIPFKKFLLCTLHREENTNDAKKLSRLFSMLNRLHSKIPIVFPMHPRTRKIVKANEIKTEIIIIDPVGYLDMITLLKNCELLMTDSGGLQKEAYFFSKFCITLRDETEWTELIKAGVNKITGTNEKKITAAVREFSVKKFGLPKKLYGDGNAAEKIVNALLKY